MVWDLVPSCTRTVAHLLGDPCVPSLQQPAFIYVMQSPLCDALSVTREMKSNKVKVVCMYSNSLMDSKLNKYVFLLFTNGYDEKCF